MTVYITAVSDVKVRLSNPAGFIALVLFDYHVYGAQSVTYKPETSG